MGAGWETKMSWLHAHQRLWRTTALILLLLSFTMPWGIDRIHVPSPYECSPPWVRLNESFCGDYVSIWDYLPAIFAGFIEGAPSLVTGEAGLDTYLIYLFITLLLLVLFFGLLLIWRGSHFLLQIIHILLLGLTAVPGLFVAVLAVFHSDGFFLGNLFYFLIAACVILCEVLVIQYDRMAVPE
jgi:hypothetical protein